MEVICLEDQAFYKLVEQVVKRLQQEHVEDDTWVSTDEAMRLLNITSKTTLQKIRDEGKITFSQPNNKRIYYNRASLLAYLDTHKKDSF